ncbi:hypothetical protein BU15DRAFT_80329 [Melanogaster broomeanus]|nr:hypothetical protein BU15DRAFT_80329 [Melanogaster broomeanus]
MHIRVTSSFIALAYLGFAAAAATPALPAVPPVGSDDLAAPSSGVAITSNHVGRDNGHKNNLPRGVVDTSVVIDIIDKMQNPGRTSTEVINGVTDAIKKVTGASTGNLLANVPRGESDFVTARSGAVVSGASSDNPLTDVPSSAYSGSTPEQAF